MSQDTPVTKEVDLLEGITQGEWTVLKQRTVAENDGYVSPVGIYGNNGCCLGFIWGNTLEESQSNALLIANAPKLAQENKLLKEQVERLKLNKDNACLLAMEFGYKQCEKGENIQSAFLNYNKITQCKG